MKEAIFNLKFEKVIKTTQNIPKTVDNHQKQLVLGLGYQLVIQASKKAEKANSKIWILSTPTTKMLKKPLFCHFNPLFSFGWVALKASPFWKG